MEKDEFIGVRVNKSLKQMLKQIAVRRGLPLSVLIRRALQSLVDEEVGEWMHKQ